MKVCFLILFLLLTACSGSPDLERAAELLEARAYVECTDAADRELVNAAFPNYEPSYVTPLDESRYAVLVPVEAENAFGGTVKTSVRCDVRKDGDVWAVEQIRVGNN